MSDAQTTPELPVDSYKDAAPYLRRPFTPQAVKFKVQATWDGGALIVPYIDARLATERLNLVVPHLWEEDYLVIGGGLMWGVLTVDGITRKDVGEGKGKGLVSDALKRAAVKFGVGVSLYAIPKMILNERDGHLRKNREGKYELTDNGLARCRQLYEAWLSGPGTQAFGEPLDHGDTDEAIGDAETEPEPEPEPAPPIAADTLLDAAIAAGLTHPQIHHWLNANGVEVPEFESAEDTLAALDRLDAEGRRRFAASSEAFKAEREAKAREASLAADAEQAA